MQRRQSLQAFAAAPLLAATTGRAAKPTGDYSSRFIRLIIGCAAGGTADMSCRTKSRYIKQGEGEPKPRPPLRCGR